MEPTEPETDAALLGALLDATVDGIIVADEKGRVVRLNRVASAMFGHAHPDLVGQSVNVLMPPRVGRLHDGYMQDYLRTGQARILGTGRELQGQRKDNTLFPLHISVGRADTGDRVLFISVLHDLSSRKAVEAELEQSLRLEAMGRMTGGVAHDFNNVLAVIKGCLELAQRQLRNPRIRPLIEDALRSTETGAHLVRQLLAFASRRAPTLGSTDVNGVVVQMGEILRRLVGDTIRLESRLQPDLPAALTDSQQLEMAVLNLMTNARDATPKGGEIRIETGTADLLNPDLATAAGLTPGIYVCLTVADTGRGMPPDDLSQAFEPFFSTKAADKGSGLGLAMVEMFAKRSGGLATIESRLGHGTTVRIFLPAAYNGSAASPRSLPPPTSPEDAPLVPALDDEP